MHYNIRHLHEERGMGGGEMLVAVVVLTVLFSGFVLLTDWIYETKESRYSPRPGVSISDIENEKGVERGPDGYRVAY